MKLTKITLILCSMVLLTACGVISPSFEPETLKGAQCKKECSHQQLACVTSSYMCDLGYAHCIEACIAIEKISRITAPSVVYSVELPNPPDA